MNLSNYIIKKNRTNISNRLLTNTNDSECINPVNGICCSKNIISNIKKYLIEQHILDEKKDDNEVINKAKGIFKCTSESCVLNKLRKTGIINESLINKELNTKFKIYGPRNSTNLLNNINIDNTLLLWAREFSFYPCPFSMIDFDIYPNKFSNINLSHLIAGKEEHHDPIHGIIKKPYDTFGCVLNTDISSGRGKHWVCIFVDLTSKKWTIEYFNSAGNAPCKNVIKWMEKQRSNLLTIHNNVETVSVTNLVHQYSMTECGVYSLYYIRARLDGIDNEHFMNNHIPDNLMIEFRTHLFRDT